MNHTDPTALRDRVAEALADIDGWQWAPGYNRVLSPAYQRYLARADKVLAVLPEPNGLSADDDACLAHIKDACDGTTRDCAFITDTGRANVLRVLVDRAARGVLNDHEATALRARANQVINGCETWKAKAEEIEKIRSILAAELEQAQAAIERVRALASQWAVLRSHGSAASELRAALDGAEQPTTTEDGTP